MASLAQKRRLDSTLGGPICAVLNLLARLLGFLLHRDHSLATPPRRILVIKLVGLGSIVHATPLLRALKAKHPATPVSFLGFREVAPLLSRLDDVDECLTLDDSTYPRLFVSVMAFVLHSWRRRFDLVIDLEAYSKFSTILSTLTCARDRAGYYLITTAFRHGLYTHLVYYNRQRHLQEAYRQLGLALGVDVPVGPTVAPRITEEERRGAEALLARWGCSERKVLVLNPNAGDLCLERRWSPERFARVAEEFAARSDVCVVLTGAPAEAAYTESVRELVPDHLRPRVANAAGVASFGEFLALLQRAAVLVTNDTGPLHLAVALDRPTVSLFGPCSPEVYRPLSGRHVVIYQGVYCSPCLHWTDEPPCAGENLCMAQIPWREVAAAAADLLGVSGPMGTEEPARVPEWPVAGYVVRKSASGPR